MSGSAGWWRSSAKANGTGIINKTKQKHNREEQRGEIKRRKKVKVGEAVIIQKIRLVTGRLYKNFSFFILSSLRS